MDAEDDEHHSQAMCTTDKWIEELSNMHIDSFVMNKLIMDYLVREGYKEAAEKFEEESGVKFTPEIEKLEEKTKIRDAILVGNIKSAITLINELYPDMLDKNRLLLFNLQLQQLIELIREGKIQEALSFAQTNLSEISEDNPECLPNLERVLSLLVFEKPEKSPFGDLLKPPQRHKIWSAVNTVFMDLQNETSIPKLSNIVRILNWSQEQLDKSNVTYPKLKELSKLDFA